MKIAVLVSDIAGNDVHPLQNVECPRNVAKYDKSGINTYDTIFLTKENATKTLVKLIREKIYDVFINLCEETEDECGPGENIVKILHDHGVPYTGADPAFYMLPKLSMKMMAVKADVAIPDHVFLNSMKDFESKIDRLKEIPNPWFVKRANGHDSVGLTEQSKVTNFEALEHQVRQMIDNFGPVVVEQFIQGPEYTVLVVENPENEAEPLALTPMQCIFPDDLDFSHFALKWVWSSFKFKAVLDTKVAERLKECARKLFKFCNANSYARFDFRMNIDSGEIYFLEVNSNCSVFYDEVAYYGSADQILTFDPLGHDGFIKLIVECALERRKRCEQKFEIGYRPKKGFFLRAAKNLEANESIYEEEPCYLPVVSRKYVDEHFSRDPNLMKSFYEYCYQCGPGLVCAWETDSKKWKPINHSCNPNAWLEGLAVVARRPIKKGEEINLDYATFAYLEDKDAEEKNQFDCHCGTKECRKIIRPNIEYKMAEIVEKYRGHFTTYLEDLVEKQARKTTNGCSSF